MHKGCPFQGTSCNPSSSHIHGCGRRCRHVKRDVVQEKRSRLSAEERALLRIIEMEPGLQLSRASERFPYGFSTLYSRLESLERQGLVKSRRDGRARLLYPVNGEVEIQRRAKTTPLMRVSSRRV